MNSMVVLVTVSGVDSSDLMPALTQVLMESGAVVLDAGRSVLHNVFALALMVQVASEFQVEDLQHAVRSVAAGSDLVVRVRRVSDSEFRKWVSRQHRRRFILTLLAPRITAAHLAFVSRVLSSYGLRIDAIERLTSRKSPEKTIASGACLQVTASGEQVDAFALRRTLLAGAVSEGLDLALQTDSVFRTNRRLIAFDMDSTLIQMEVIDELARLAGVGSQVASITELAMRGKLDFNDSFRRRLALLKGLPASAAVELAHRLPLTPGVPRLLSVLKSIGYKTAILSGGFSCFARALQERFGFDYICANELEIQQGYLTGRAIDPIVNGARKADMLRDLAAQTGISMEQTVAVGDGANDIPMLSIAGLGVAFRAKPVVRESARSSISLMGLDAILYLLGLRDREIEFSLAYSSSAEEYDVLPPSHPLYHTSQLPVELVSSAS